MGDYMDYYKILDELHGKEGNHRTEVVKLLEKAWNTWTNRVGLEAILKQSMIRKAIDIFKDQNEYNKFRQHILKERYIPLIEGLLFDGKLTIEKRKFLQNRAKKDGFSHQEINELLSSLKF